jgi:uncharacterized protein (TIGR03905 family)
MAHHVFTPEGVCARKIEFDKDENGIITNVSFSGGCNGNLKAVSKLINGMSAQKINEILAGNLCGFKSTSCADQLAKAVINA